MSERKFEQKRKPAKNYELKKNQSNRIESRNNFEDSFHLRMRIRGKIHFEFVFFFFFFKQIFPALTILCNIIKKNEEEEEDDDGEW